jgi:mannose-1-phosphate guanylyltransferase
MPIEVVILAGGGGTRLHPLSTPERPKPFLPLLTPVRDGEPETLIQRTVRRLLDGPELGGLERTAITVVAAAAHAPHVRTQLPGVTVIEEPVGRNTAPAIALAAMAPGHDEAVMAVLPADHLIEREAAFRAVLRTAAERLATGAFSIDGPLVTLGVQVSRPATEYGYLIPEVGRGATVGGLDAYPLRRFEEKPSPRRADALLREPGVAWNAGMFVWRRRAIRAALETHAPDVAGTIAGGLRSGRLDEAYARVRSVSIDYAVMEPAAAAGRVVMAAMDVGWSDLGGWTALLEALGARGTGRVVQPGETATAGPGDLVVRRVGGRLTLEPGPREGILDSDGPSALLTGAAADASIVEALLARCSPPEAGT